jgi:hypothetical protein
MAAEVTPEDLARMEAVMMTVDCLGLADPGVQVGMRDKYRTYCGVFRPLGRVWFNRGLKYVTCEVCQEAYRVKHV